MERKRIVLSFEASFPFAEAQDLSHATMRSSSLSLSSWGKRKLLLALPFWKLPSKAGFQKEMLPLECKAQSEAVKAQSSQASAEACQAQCRRLLLPSLKAQYWKFLLSSSAGESCPAVSYRFESCCSESSVAGSCSA